MHTDMILGSSQDCYKIRYIYTRLGDVKGFMSFDKYGGGVVFSFYILLFPCEILSVGVERETFPEKSPDKMNIFDH